MSHDKRVSIAFGALLAAVAVGLVIAFDGKKEPDKKDLFIDFIDDMELDNSNLHLDATLEFLASKPPELQIELLIGESNYHDVVKDVQQGGLQFFGGKFTTVTSRSGQRIGAQVSNPYKTSYKVYGVEGSSDDKRVSGWLAAYHKHTNTTPLFCSIMGCSKEAVQGAHVHRYSDKDESIQYIIPTCRTHNSTKTNGKKGSGDRMSTKPGTVFMKISAKE